MVKEGKMDIKELKQDYIKGAVQLALIEYKNECRINMQLGEKDYQEILKSRISDMFQSKYGLVSIEEGEITGYLIFWGGISNLFGNVKGAFSPLFGSAFAGGDRKKTASILFQKVTEIMVSDGICSLAICKYAHDKEIMETLIFNSFGIRCSDAVRDLTKPIFKVDGTNSSDNSKEENELKRSEINNEFKLSSDIYSEKNNQYLNKGSLKIKEIPYQEAGILLDLKNQLDKYFSSSPIFMLPHYLEAEEFSELCNRKKSRFFVAWEKERPVGYIKVDTEAETFITEDPDTLNICGAYVSPEYRNGFAAKELLSFVIHKIADEGVKFLGVDFETMNPAAFKFWSKYFESYTYSYVRRIDERILDVFIEHE